jgi:sulfur transfer complex TusBCD TusB component (DsrH family)
VNAKMQFGVFMLKINRKGRGFESQSGQFIIFQIKYTKIVKLMLESAKSIVSEVER